MPIQQLFSIKNSYRGNIAILHYFYDHICNIVTKCGSKGVRVVITRRPGKNHRFIMTAYI